MYIFTLLIIVVIPLCLVLMNRKKTFLKEFPAPPGNLLFGHALEIGSTTNIIKVSSRFIENHGTIVKLVLGPKIAPAVLALLTTDYKFIEFLLSGNQILTKSDNYMYLIPWLGSGLLISDGQRWKKHRKILTPAFHFEILKQFVGVFESVGSILINKLTDYSNSPSVDLYPLVTLCTLDIIAETAMGTKINAQSGENSGYVRSVKEMCRVITDRCLSPLKIYKWTFVFTKDYYLQKKLLKILHGFTSDVITSKKEMLKTKDINKGSGSKKMAFLDLMLKYSEDGKLLSHDEIREEVDTFMFEGHDTTASGICFTLFCLANHPEIQEKVLNEQKELFGNEKDPLVTSQELQNMKYLEMVIKEALRVYPPVPFIGRCTKEDVEFNGSTIPKNTNLLIFIYGILRNPKYFPDPEKFNPDRFIDLDSSLPYAYIPFSAGSRNCIGQKFAMLEMKSVISKVIRHFELIPAIPKHDLVLAAEAVLKSVSGVKVGLKKRT